MNKATNFTLFGFLALCLASLGLQAQEKVVNVRIITESDGYKAVIDTTFSVEDEDQIEEILDLIEDRNEDGDESVETVIIIRDKKRKDSHVNVHTNRNQDSHSNAAPKGMMGVYLDTDGQGRGVEVTALVNGGAAQAAGLQAGDIITAIDGEAVKTYHDLVDAKEGYGIGDRMRIAYLRDGRRNNTSLVLRSKEQQQKMATIMRWEEEGVPRAFLGVYTDEVTAERARAQGMDTQQGVYIEGVVPGGGAEQAGLREGDIITEMDDQIIDASHEMTEFLRDKRPGDPIKITYMRDGRACNVSSVLGRRESVVKEKQKIEKKKPFLGIYFSDHNGEGVYVTGIVENSSAAEAGLEKGDVITGMGDFDIENGHDLGDALQEIGAGGRTTLYYERDERDRRSPITLGYKTYTKWETVERYQDSGEDEMDMIGEEVEVEVEVNELFNNFSDPQRGAQLREFMENPSLEMDLFEFFPNPNDGRFTLRFEPAQAGDLQVRIYSPNGQEIYQEQINDFSGTYDKAIDISRNVSNGVYFLQVTQGQQGMVQRIIVK